MTRAVRLACWSLALATSVFALACDPGTPPGEWAKETPAQAETPLAQAPLPGSNRMLWIAAVTRGGSEALEVTFALVPAGASPAAAPAPKAPPGTNAPAEGPQGRIPGSVDWLAATYLIDEALGKRFYVMRDAEGRPKCTPPEPAEGGRQVMSARFPAPGPGAGVVTVAVPGLPPFRGIPFPGTPSGGPSY